MILGLYIDPNYRDRAQIRGVLESHRGQVERVILRQATRGVRRWAEELSKGLGYPTDAIALDWGATKQESVTHYERMLRRFVGECGRIVYFERPERATSTYFLNLCKRFGVPLVRVPDLETAKEMTLPLFKGA